MRYQSFFLCLLLSGQCFGEDKVVMQHQGTSFRQSDVVRAVKSFVPPEQLGAVFADEKKLRDTIARIFVQRKLAEEASVRQLSPEDIATIEEAKLRAQSQVQIEYLLKKHPEPDFEAIAKETYTANKEAYATQERVHVEHVLIDLKSRKEDEALARAEEVIALLNKGDRKFADVAKEYSDDPSATRNGGDLGFFSKGAMVKAFEEKAFAMTKTGELSAPVRTDFGFHVIRYLGRESAGYLPFEQVKDRLVKEEKSKFRNKVLGEEFERVSKVEGVVVDQDAIKEMVKTPLVAPKR
jgi:parvulin-like peptidyl-prolyl isomerase